MRDELEDAMDGLDAQGPLFDALMAELDAEPLAVHEAEVQAVAEVLEARFAPRSTPWMRWLIAAAVVGAIGVGLSSWLRPGPEPTPAAPDPEPIEVPREPLPRDPLEAWDVLTSRLDAGDPVFESDVMRLAMQMHNRGRMGDDTAMLEAAAEVYAVYIETFGDRRGGDVHYAAAELAYQLEDFELAYERYLVVAEEYPDNKHAAFCAESAVFAAERLDDPEAELLVGAVQAYSELDAAEDDKLRVLAYRAGFALVDVGRPDEAAPWLQQVIDLDPESREAEMAEALLAGE